MISVNTYLKMLECSHKIKGSKDLSMHFNHFFHFLCFLRFPHFYFSSPGKHDIYLFKFTASLFNIQMRTKFRSSLSSAVKTKTKSTLSIGINSGITLMRSYGFLYLFFTFQNLPFFKHADIHNKHFHKTKVTLSNFAKILSCLAVD